METRSTRKRRTILDAAAAAFLDNGYARTSMDEIAALAGVSKPTVYKHFASKERLFSEIVLTTIDKFTEPFYDEVRSLEDSDDIEIELRHLAHRLLGMVMKPELLQIRRLVIGEAGSFPDLGRTFHERGPGRAIAALTTEFELLAERGALRLDDPPLAAAHFNWLILSIPLNQAMLCGGDEPPTQIELERYADGGVCAFLAAYGPRRGHDVSH
jgi:TetR/AcrR family transcriptional regulator, mexJK operon transcriptional repressor